MPKYRNCLISGMVIFVLSTAGGLGGAFWGIHRSFDALQFNENAGIGAVGAGLWLGVITAIIGLIGALVGFALMGIALVNGRKSI